MVDAYLNHGFHGFHGCYQWLLSKWDEPPRTFDQCPVGPVPLSGHSYPRPTDRPGGNRGPNEADLIRSTMMFQAARGRCDTK